MALISSSANLIARSDVHPAVAFLLLDIASEVHSRGGPLHSLKEFPNERNLDFEQSDESKRFFKTGRPFLQRYLPFWLANLIERLLVSALLKMNDIEQKLPNPELGASKYIDVYNFKSHLDLARARLS